MHQALPLAQQAATEGETPAGPLTTPHPPGSDPKITAQGYNRRKPKTAPPPHAEIVALRPAGQALNPGRMIDCPLYVTRDPCPMCAGAMVQGRLTRLVY